MEINRCLSCMQQTQGGACPHCGFDPEKQSQPEYALPYNHILHGRYMIGKVLGQGGFGITYVGWDLALEVKVAIKEFYPSGQAIRNRTMGLNLCWSSTAQSRTMRESGMSSFLKEARKMSKVESIPEVVRVRDTFAENETAYIVMDFVEGETLKQRLDRRGVISWQEAQEIFLPVISAMARVHKAGIVHRDLSPDNLMLGPDGSVRILDLGAAKDMSSNNGVTSMQVIKGGFSPVEQYGVSGGSGTWTDVYSLAATMYYSLSGRLPDPAIERLDEDKLLWDLPQLNKLPIHVHTALQKAMAVKPQQRTQTMEELLEALKTPAGATPPPPPPPSADDPPKKKHWLLWLFCGIAAVAMICLLSGVHAHKWEEATCTAPKTCSVCGKTEGQPLEHKWVDASCVSPKRCEVCGMTAGGMRDHEWADATCLKAKHCIHCGKIQGDPLDHKWVGATCEEAKHCDRCGKTDGSPLGHRWIDATCEAKKLCTVCGKEEGSPLGHDWKEATYEAPKTCRRCGRTEGSKKGYFEKVTGTWGKERVQPGWSSGPPLILEHTIENCTKLTLNITVTAEFGTPFGFWTLYGKDLNGKWQKLGSFDVPDEDELTVEMEFSTPQSFSEIFAARSQAVQYNTRWWSDYYLTDVYCRDD